MKLLTKQLLKQFEDVWKQETKKDPLVVVKFFCSWNSRSWFATEYDPDTKEFFWYVDWLDAERGYFSLLELKSLSGPYGLSIERDLYFESQLCSVVWIPIFDCQDMSLLDGNEHCLVPESEYTDWETTYWL